MKRELFLIQTYDETELMYREYDYILENIILDVKKEQSDFVETELKRNDLIEIIKRLKDKLKDKNLCDKEIFFINKDIREFTACIDYEIDDLDEDDYRLIYKKA